MPYPCNTGFATIRAMTTTPYTPRRASRSRFLDIRDIRYHLREWGEPGMPRLFMLHGWCDASASFQFTVDALAREWHVVAPDWRGFGLSGWNASGAYWVPDYLADLELLLEHESPHEAVRLVGHSLGGNIALLYAGVRPNRVSQVVAVEAYGRGDADPERAPEQLAGWLEQFSRPMRFRDHADTRSFARAMRLANPRLSAERAQFLAEMLTRRDAQDKVRLAADPAHRHLNPVLYRRREAEACWRRITAAVLVVVQDDPAWRYSRNVDDATWQAMCACFSRYNERRITECGHNIHQDQPERLAECIEAFLER